MIKNNFIKKLGAGFMAGLCAFSMLGAAINNGISANAAQTDVFPSADTVIAKAATLLGTPYGYGFKGYTGVYYQDSYKPLTESYIRQQGIDCSGLVYYTLTQLGYETSGFSWNNPVPVDTAHWLTVDENCTFTYGGVTSKADVEKKNIAADERPYWECADGSAITPGSVVIAENPGGIDHAWIYMGEFDSRNSVVSYLKNIGVAENLINNSTVSDGKGDGGKHWRIESNGSEGVVINNNTDGKKSTALNISAFKITKTDVEFSITKVRKTDSVVINGISKVDGSKAVYGVYSDKSCTKKVAEITIGEDGKGSVKLPDSAYYVKEISAPTGYALSPDVTELKVNQNVFVYEDFQTGKIRINKTAEDNIVKDIEFKVIGSDGSSYTKKTDSKGFAEFSGLKAYDVDTGKAIVYTVSEINVDSKYEIPKSQNITLTNGDVDLSVNVDFKNVLKKFTAEVIKKDSENGSAQGNATLSGAVYGLYLDGKLIDKYTTDENGYFKTKKHVCGNYTIQEISSSEGYLLDETVYNVGAEPENYKVESNPISLNVAEDVIKGKISIIKHSGDGATQIETPEFGAEFEVYLKTAGSYKNAKDSEKDYLVCDENGYAATKMLPYGVYIVHQTKGWDNTEWIDDFEVNISGNEKDYFYLINDSVLTSYVKIVKKDAETGRIIPVSGIGFKVWDCTNNAYVSQKINYPTETELDTFYTNETGTLMLPNELAYGDYELHEVQAANGYFLDGAPTPFTIDGTIETVMVEKFNTPQKGRISVQKSGDSFITVNVNGEKYTPVFEEKELANAVYEVIAAEDIVTPDGTVRANAGDVVSELTTDETGYAETDLLYLGKHEIKEKTAPDGYVKNDEIQSVELTYAGQEIEVRDTVNTAFVNNYQGLEISLEKVMESDERFNIYSEDYYKNVRFGLFADEEITAAEGSSIPENRLIAEVSLGEDMTIVIAEKVPFGKYYVQEIATDEHYVLNGEKYLVNFEYMGQEMTTMYVDCGQFENRLKHGKIEGLKVNEAEESLENAVFGLFKSAETTFTEETAIITDISDKNGCFEFDEIPCGEYIVREIEAPTGYVLSDKSYPVTVCENDETIKIKAVNKPITVEISKQDIYGNELAGAEMELIDENGETVDKWTSDGTNHVVERLSAGSYVLKETAAPDGYVIASDIRFSVDIYGAVTVENVDSAAFSEDGNPLVVMTDECIPTPEIPFTPTGDTSSRLPGILMLGVAFVIFVMLRISKKRKENEE